MKVTPYLLSLLTFLPATTAAEVEVVVSPRVTVVQREGITGGGCPVKVGERVLSFYPNHPDDFGGSKGMASAISTDGGLSWTKGRDNWPMSGMIALGTEVVVDYSLRLKSELSRPEGPAIWVAGYSNVYSGYIPSRRVLLEGGYEARSRPWHPDLEERIVKKVHDIVGQLKVTTDERQ